MRKKIFAVIMSAMMMITFMPSMAFATEAPTPGELSNYTFNDDFTKCSAKLVITGSTLDVSTTNITKTFHDNGSISAEADFTSVLTGYAVDEKTYEEAYYDLTGATIVNADGDDDYVLDGKIESDDYLDFVDELTLLKTLSSTAGDVWDYEDHEGDFGPLVNTYLESPLGEYVHFERPAGVTNGPTSADAYYDDLPEGITINVKPCGFEAYDADGEYSFPVVIKKTNKSYKNIIGSVNTTQKANIYTPINSGWDHIKWSLDGGKYVDSDELFGDLGGEYALFNWGYLPSEDFSATEPDDEYSGLDIETEYVAEDQKLSVSAKNIKVEYGVYDKEEGAYVYSTKAPTVKDVKASFLNAGDPEDMYYTYKLKLTKDSKVRYLNVGIMVVPVMSQLKFKQNSFVYGIGEEVKTSDLVNLTTYRGFFGPFDSPFDSYKESPVYAADQAAVNALIDKVLSVNGLIENEGTSTLTIAEDMGSITELLDLIKNPEQMQVFNNYDFIDGMADSSASATFTRTNKANDVTAPNKTKTYHIKKAKKLASNKTFNLKATADYGKITFTKMSGNSKIKVAADGKVTVKKGLKKGTYAVKVKVKAPNAKDTMTLKVKIKK